MHNPKGDTHFYFFDKKPKPLRVTCGQCNFEAGPNIAATEAKRSRLGGPMR